MKKVSTYMLVPKGSVGSPPGSDGMYLFPTSSRVHAPEQAVSDDASAPTLPIQKGATLRALV